MGKQASKGRSASRVASVTTPSSPDSLLRTIAICVLLAAAVWIVFGPTVHHEFVNYDDDKYVYANPNITGGITPPSVVWAFTHVHAANWHPLTTISHMLDCQFYGVQPWGHHLTNVLLHAVASILLFFALRSLTGTTWSSAFVAALFAVHPLRVESVAWISERKDVLSGVFFMFTLLAYAHYARLRRFSFPRYLILLVAFALGLMCKPTLVTVPFLLLLLDFWPLRRFQTGNVPAIRTVILEKIPLIMLSVLACVATIQAQKEAFATMSAAPLQERVANAAVSYVEYVKQMVWPAHLAVLYSYPQGTLRAVEVGLAILLLWLVPVTFFFLRKAHLHLIVGWFWFVGMLVPMIGLVQVGSQARADRYTYLPQIGLYIVISWSAAELLRRAGRLRIVAATAAFLILAAMMVLARNQTAVWQDSVTLWQNAAGISAGNYIVHQSLGNAFLERNRFPEAIAQYEQALALRPDLAPVQSNYGVALLREGRVDEATAHLQKAMAINQGYPEAYNDMGIALLKQGRAAEAISYYDQAVALNPDYAEAHNNLGAVLLENGQLSESIDQYRKAVAAKPSSAEMRCNLANALAKSGDWTGAIDSYRAALAIQPNYVKASNNLGVSLETIRRNEEAFEQFKRAVEIDPGYPEAQYNLGRVLAQRGQRTDAIAHLNEALRLQPNYQEAKEQLRKLGVEPDASGLTQTRP